MIPGGVLLVDHQEGIDMIKEPPHEVRRNKKATSIDVALNMIIVKD
jgi:hypothetical protein